jgi:hypothetical protein
MGPEQKYRTSAGFRVALEERLNRWVKETGQDLMRLRRQAAFDRLLARLLAGRTGPLISKLSKGGKNIRFCQFWKTLPAPGKFHSAG